MSPLGAPLSTVGAYSGADALYLPYKYRTATALHVALALAPTNTVGELWGPSALIMRARLVNQGGTYRLYPLGWVDLSATSSTGAEWDYSGVLGSPDYRWRPVDAATAPTWAGSSPGLNSELDGALYCPGLARLVYGRTSLYARTAAATFSGSPAAVIPRVYAGWWRIVAGVASGLTASAGQGTVGAATWQRAQISGDPDAPANALAPIGALTAPTAAVIPLAYASVGVDQVSPRALYSGGWQPALDAAGGTPGATATQGSAGQALVVCLGALAGDATAPADLVWAGFEYSGGLAAV